MLKIANCSKDGDKDRYSAERMVLRTANCRKDDVEDILCRKNGAKDS